MLADGTYKGMVFQLTIPSKGYKEGGKILERYQKAEFYPNKNSAALTSYLKELVVGEYLLDEEPTISHLLVYVNRAGDADGTLVHISFRVQGHEPKGNNRFWMAWQQYNEYDACVATDTCLIRSRVIHN